MKIEESQRQSSESASCHKEMNKKPQKIVQEEGTDEMLPAENLSKIRWQSTFYWQLGNH